MDVITRRVQSAGGDRALIRHLDVHPVDALALAAAVPTTAFSGATDLDDDYALRLVERTSPAYDGHWFHTSLLAFLRQAGEESPPPARVLGAGVSGCPALFAAGRRRAGSGCAGPCWRGGGW
ncbi:hypothetical protein AB0I51_39915 [Streptomyces sp. NPDC050549]|uniref:hypothetical protein n=1 Tax=Streptomyces sp. NPDC050549 TaxID=3155406 RepID=UPI003414E5CF